jgi:hypothetical protein
MRTWRRSSWRGLMIRTTASHRAAGSVQTRPLRPCRESRRLHCRRRIAEGFCSLSCAGIRQFPRLDDDLKLLDVKGDTGTASCSRIDRCRRSGTLSLMRGQIGDEQ